MAVAVVVVVFVDGAASRPHCAPANPPGECFPLAKWRRVSRPVYGPGSSGAHSGLNGPRPDERPDPDAKPRLVKYFKINITSIVSDCFFPLFNGSGSSSFRGLGTPRVQSLGSETTRLELSERGGRDMMFLVVQSVEVRLTRPEI